MESLDNNLSASDMTHSLKEYGGTMKSGIEQLCQFSYDEGVDFGIAKGYEQRKTEETTVLLFGLLAGVVVAASVAVFKLVKTAVDKHKNKSKEQENTINDEQYSANIESCVDGEEVQDDE